MGLGIYTKGQGRQKGWFLNRPSSLQLLDAIERFFLNTSDPLWQQLIQADKTDDKLLITLYPAEEPIEFSPDGKQHVICSAKTNSAGPGYHAFLVEILEKCGESANIEWEWGSTNSNDYMDETGYQYDKDFPELQKQMANWLKSLASTLCEKKDSQITFMISLPMGFLIEANNFFAISPLGVWPYEWFQNVTQCKCKNIFQYCKEFFPWWQKDQDASFWLNMALTLLWVDCPWHTPANRKESMTLQNIIACLENAYLLDPTLKYPWSEWLEILELLEAPDKVQTLKQRMPDKTTSTGIGFRKMNCSWNLTGQWHIWIPGYFYSDLEDNDSSVVLWYKGRTVRGSSISFEGTPRPSLDELMDDKSSFAEIIPLETQEEIDGYAGLKEIDEDGKKYWMLQGAAVSSKSMAYITICFDDINDKKWACDAWQSISLHQAQ